MRRWADSGRIACQRTPSGQRRFLADDLERVLGDGGPAESLSRLSAGERAEQRYQLLFETSLELASSLELGRVLQSAAQRLSAALEIPDCDIYRLEGGERLVCLASAPGVLRRLLGGPGVLASTTGPAPARRRDAPRRRVRQPRRPAAERSGTRQTCARYGQHSFVALPLIARDKVIGVVDLLDHVERQFTDEEIAIAEAVGQLVALALEHAHLYDEVKRLHLGNLRP